ncbi:MAG: RluA family pseudouridine synthase [Candidatus Latescibacterota bacterium]|nr:MAG: RluA family pseudouridine synthase [Candidatus Latescibacterota bacterium]
MAKKKKITLECSVDSYRSGWTVVEFLAHRFKYHTPERWAQRVTEGWVQVNGADVEPVQVVNKNDVISYTIWHAEPEVDFRFDVVYEDDFILAVSKSGNIPVHASGVYIRNTLIATLKNIYGDHLNLAHRLDRETSGIVLLSKDARTARVLGKMFADGRVDKSYIAVVHGVVADDRFEVDAPIGKTTEEATGRFDADALDSDLKDDLPRYVPRRLVDREKGKPAVTRFEVIERRRGFTVVRAHPLQGRTNQIRVHLEHIGHPILGDKVYGPSVGDEVDGAWVADKVDGAVGDNLYGHVGNNIDGPSTDVGIGESGQPAGPENLAPLPVQRQALHCAELVFDHPVTGKPTKLSAELPPDMKKLISKLPVD